MSSRCSQIINRFCRRLVEHCHRSTTCFCTRFQAISYVSPRGWSVLFEPFTRALKGSSHIRNCVGFKFDQMKSERSGNTACVVKVIHEATTFINDGPAATATNSLFSRNHPNVFLVFVPQFPQETLISNEWDADDIDIDLAIRLCLRKKPTCSIRIPHLGDLTLPPRIDPFPADPPQAIDTSMPDLALFICASSDG